MLRSFINDDKGSWLMIGVAALVIFAAMSRMSDDRVSKKVEAEVQGQSSIQTGSFAKGSKKCKPAVAENQTNNEVLTALKNVVTSFSGSQGCKPGKS